MLLLVALKEGKYETYKKFIHQFTVVKSDEYKDFLKRYGLKNTQMWHHVIEGKDYMLWSHDATPDAKNLIPQFATSTHDFDVWFKAQLGECLATAPQVPEFLFEFNV